MAINFEKPAVKDTYFGEDKLQLLIYDEKNRILKEIEELDNDFRNGKIKSLCGLSSEGVYNCKRHNLIAILKRLEQGKTSLYDVCDINGKIIGEYGPSRFVAFQGYYEEKHQKEEAEKKEKREAEIIKNLKYNI